LDFFFTFFQEAQRVTPLCFNFSINFSINSTITNNEDPYPITQWSTDANHWLWHVAE